LLRAGRAWRPPVFVLWIARRLGYGFDNRVVSLAVVRAGFAGRGQVWRAGFALASLCRACRPRRRRRGYIYKDHDLLVRGEPVPRRYGAPEWALRPTWHASPAGPASTGQRADQAGHSLSLTLL
jgi:hypothetical protein